MMKSLRVMLLSPNFTIYYNHYSIIGSIVLDIDLLSKSTNVNMYAIVDGTYHNKLLYKPY